MGRVGGQCPARRIGWVRSALTIDRSTVLEDRSVSQQDRKRTSESAVGESMIAGTT